MTDALRVLMISSEVASLARTGGLGDVVEGLSHALAGLGVDVVVVTPKYAITQLPPRTRSIQKRIVAPLGLGHARDMGVLEATLGSPEHSGVRVFMLSDAELFDRRGIYGDRYGTFGDNAFRFAALSSGALAVAALAWDGRSPDIVHAHDWHAALAVVYTGQARDLDAAWASVKTVFTIHNLAFQGVIGEAELDYLAIPRRLWNRGIIRHDGRVNLMKGGIELADRVTTVSETYAHEIQQPERGYGLEAHLRWHSGKLAGIVNGIDTASFDPRADTALARRYGDGDAQVGKSECKRAVLAELGLPEAEPDAPLFALVSRLEWLKGVDQFLAILPWLVTRGARVALVGTGEANLESVLRAAAIRWPHQVASRTAFDPLLARRLFAGADFLMVPSRDEPCGLTQMYAMRYGAIPIVTPVGGLRDTVQPLDIAHGHGTGIVAAACDATSLLLACEEALDVWRDPIAMAALIARAMAQDNAWSKSARKYVELYNRVRREKERDSQEDGKSGR